MEGSPLYVLDLEALGKRICKFRDAFTAVRPDIRIYYALKSNSHPEIVSAVVSDGIGLDVSSGLELKTALEVGAHDIVFSGPGKTGAELDLAIENADRVTVLMDSFSELRRLGKTAERTATQVRAGVRLTSDDIGIWRKFGIPLSRLREFFEEAHKYRYVSLNGLQIHLSWNLGPEAQVRFIKRLGAALAGMNRKQRSLIRFVDIGGGFWPEEGEWLQPAATPIGMLRAAHGELPFGGRAHYCQPARPIAEFAQTLAAALKDHFPPDMNFTVCVEPGRWLCHGGMHIVVTIEDQKSPDVVITDGGTNAVGWDRFENDYFPVINLTRPSLEEHECLVAGSLCTPHDLWGYSYFGKGVRQGDVLLVPNQGAYTYSLRQEFIKPLPKTAVLPPISSGTTGSESRAANGAVDNNTVADSWVES